MIREPAEILEDIVLLCGKVFADHEENEKVYVGSCRDSRRDQRAAKYGG